MSKSKKREMEKVWMERALKAEGEVEVLKSQVAGLMKEVLILAEHATHLQHELNQCDEDGPRVSFNKWGPDID